MVHLVHVTIQQAKLKSKYPSLSIDLVDVISEPTVEELEEILNTYFLPHHPECVIRRKKWHLVIGIPDDEKADDIYAELLLAVKQFFSSLYEGLSLQYKIEGYESDGRGIVMVASLVLP